MTQRTCDIIMACKGKLYPDNPDIVDRVRSHMAYECMCDKRFYSDQEMTRIILLAIYDYIDTCDRPSVFLRGIVECIGGDGFLEKACIAFSLVQVMDSESGKYINGFSDELWRYHE